ncbi:MAG TPA: hypothetical protein PLK63_04905 [Catalimonadaceae bacterium]|nr:hypothetical protein [Catalimonadaceae bacterium]
MAFKNSFLPHWVTSRNVLMSLFFILSAYVFLNGNWLRTRYPFQMDANGYYIYLPAFFVYHDMANLKFVDGMPEQFDRKYFLYKNGRGGYLSKYSPGIAILEIPFFLAAHILAPSFGYEQSGYSPPYRFAIAISTIFFTCLAFWILAIILSRYFSRGIVLSTIILLFLGTNIFFYGVLQAGVTHNYLLFILCLMLLFLDNWWRGSGWQYFAFACACVGFSALIRPTEILTGLIPVGFLFQRWKDQGCKMNHLPLFAKEIGGGIVAFLFFIFPIFLFWKFATGSWVAYTYEQEGFYFDRPSQIWYGLFGFRKGWFIYTPMAALALSGLFFLFRDQRLKGFYSAILWFLPFNIFIVLSWYCWWYGGCFGQRAFIPVLALLAFPLALLLEKAVRARILVYVCAICFLFLNVFQSFQYQRQIIHMDAMTWESYAFVFGKWKLSDDQIRRRNSMLDRPDYLQRGKKLNEYFK